MKKSYSRYPQYKETQKGFYIELPVHWDIAKVKQIARIEYGDSLIGDSREDGDFPVFGSNGKVGTHAKSNTKGPTIIIGRKGSFGKINYCDSSCFTIDTTFYIDNSLTHNNIRWLYYFLSILGLDAYSQDSAVPGLPRDSIYECWVPVIPLPEQQAIADFLDRETAHIDALIAKYQRMIDLLEEQRTALISQAVTKGLDPSVKMKDSGIEWLGEIPAHWRFHRLKFCVNISDEKLFERPEEEQYIALENIESWTGRLLLENPIETVESTVTVFSEGDILFGKLRPYLAKVVKAPFNGVCSTEILVVHPKGMISSNYLFYMMISTEFINSINALTYGTKMPRANKEQIRDMVIPIPPVTEQQAIADFLDRETTLIDALTTRGLQMIERLSEYRASLISSAVTGKIDVR